MSEGKKLLEEKELTIELKKNEKGEKINCPKPYKTPKRKERKLFKKKKT